MPGVCRTGSLHSPEAGHPARLSAISAAWLRVTEPSALCSDNVPSRGLFWALLPRSMSGVSRMGSNRPPPHSTCPLPSAPAHIDVNCVCPRVVDTYGEQGLLFQQLSRVPSTGAGTVCVQHQLWRKELDEAPLAIRTFLRLLEAPRWVSRLA